MKKELLHLPIYKHFCNNNHTQEDMMIQILYQSNFTNKNEITQDLSNMELTWTKILNTAYPFGCNDQVKGYGNRTEEQNFELQQHHPYFQYPCQRRYRSHGIPKRSKRKSQISINAINDAWKRFCSATQHSVRSNYTYLRSLPKHVLKALLSKALSNKKELSHDRLLTLYYTIATTIPKTNSSNDRQQTYRWKVGFPNKGMELIHLETILKDRKLLRTLPRKPSKPISITFTYQTPNKLRLCNYTQTLRRLTLQKLQQIIQTPCTCNESKYLYPPLNHVVTGDLNIITNTNLRIIFEKGAKYRSKPPISWTDNDNEIEQSLQQLLNWLTKDLDTTLPQLQSFYTRFHQIYNHRKEVAKQELSTYQHDNISWHDLKKLQQTYIITVVDKAPNNLILMCKKLFMETICQELGINTNTWEIVGNTVYTPVTECTDDIVKKHIRLSNMFGIKLDTDKIGLSSIYPIPKLHKNPYKFRFIASSRNSSIKPLSIILDKILGHIKTHFKNYCLKIKERTGINPWWSLESTYDFLNLCHSIQRKPTQNYTIYSGDFSEMFTSISHSTLKHNLYFIIGVCFNNKGYKFISIKGNQVSYSNTESKNTLSFTKEDICQMIEIILDNNYVTFANYITKQTKGVPMGSSCAPKMIDLAMAYHEYKFMTDPSNKELALELTDNTGRYVDDFFGYSKHDISAIATTIYPRELKLNKTSTDYHTHFLDTTVLVVNQKLVIQVYNKTDDFPFSVIKYSHSASNVHSALGYNTLYGEVLRFARICNDTKAFQDRCRAIYHEFMKLGYEQHKILITIFKCFHRNTKLMIRHNIFGETDIVRFGNIIQS